MKQGDDITVQDYNKTLNLPKTDFPMRAGLPKMEPGMLNKWDEEQIYEKLMEKNEGRPLYVLHDGPPYANGDIHMGTALNKVLKDFIIRYKNMSGFKAPYVPGWDTHGLPIESQILKTGKIDRDKLSIPEFRDKCRDFAMRFLDSQRNQFKRLGVLGDWYNPYITLTPDYEAEQVKIFGEMSAKGLIYKGLKPVYWCPHDETALAEAEIEYADDVCDSIYVKFRLEDDGGKLSKYADLSDIYFVIWTTTTWTLPGNMAICLNPDYEYALVKAGAEVYIIAAELSKNVMDAAKINDYEILCKLKGSEFEHMKAQHPFLPRSSHIVMGGHVTLEAGTGCVHTAPGHGLEDFIACKQYNIPVIVPVSGKGVMTQEAGPFSGMYYEKANAAIAENLRESGALLTAERLTHSYPHCWRCKKPVIYRATEQWFASVDAIKEAAVEACRDVKWNPAWGEERMIAMVRERADWCVSRQRNWGVPIPIFYCDKCNKEIITPETIQKISDIFRAEGSNAWHQKSAAELMPEGFRCPVCGHDGFTKETDIMDVWFDSGSSHRAVLEARDYLHFPADMYLEGGDQFRGWFQSSLLTSVATRGVAPYKAVLSHGWTVDGDGRKMSKSLGNYVVPEEIVRDYGADILRLWVSSVDYRMDVRISKEIYRQLSDIYLKIRNTARYILGNLDGFDPNSPASYEDMPELDRWALSRLNKLIARVRKGYEDYEYHVVYHGIHNFCVVDMSNFYLDVIKDRLYCETPNGAQRKSAQTAMYIILDAMVRMLAPILAFTADEIWRCMPHQSGSAQSAALCEFPEIDPQYDFSPELDTKWDKILALRLDVNKAMELAREKKLIGKSLEARVSLSFTGESKAAYESIKDSGLTTLLMVSALEVKDSVSGMDGENFEGVSIEIGRADGAKCPRCWIYSDETGKDAEHPELCPRCAAVVRELL